jgi:hypothetical protein
MNVSRYEELKSEVDRLQRDIDRTEGVHQERLNQLKSEYGCDTLEEAKALLEKKQIKAKQAERKYEDALNRFEEEWGDVLGDDSRQQSTCRRQ